MNGLRFDHCEQTRAHMAPQRRGGLFLFFKLVVQALLARYMYWLTLAAVLRFLSVMVVAKAKR